MSASATARLTCLVEFLSARLRQLYVCGIFVESQQWGNWRLCKCFLVLEQKRAYFEFVH